jgi:hypothetical protein
LTFAYRFNSEYEEGTEDKITPSFHPLMDRKDEIKRIKKRNDKREFEQMIPT